MRDRRFGLTFWLAALAALLVAQPAFADQVVVKRHVTLREEPSRTADALDYPAIGASFVLLDDGAKQHGYYHVALPDGRSAWIYATFVERRPDAVAGPPTELQPAVARMAVHYIDVDQGAAALLEFPCGAVLIDAGGRGPAASDHLIAYLDAFFARRTDLNRRLAAVFVTHTHIDHNSNLKRVAAAFVIGGYIHNGILTGSGRFNAKWMSTYVPASGPAIAKLGVTEAMVDATGTAGLTNAVIDPVNCAGVDPKIRVLSGSYADNPGWPDGDFDNGNNQSLVIRIDFGKASFLFTGDMEDTALDTLVDRFAGTTMLDTDVYTVGHHGSYNGTTLSLLKAVTPKIAVLSMGHYDVQGKWTAWAYGHPREDAVMMLVGGVTTDRGAPASVMVASKVRTFYAYQMVRAVYGTGWDGDVTIDADSAGTLTVTPGR